MMSGKWDRRFLELARHVAGWSKDPSTKAGAVIVDDANRIVSLGFNGFARGVADDTGRYADRETKYRLVVHAEVNAVLFAGRRLDRCTLYVWPLPPCGPCAAILIQSGVRRVVAPPLPAVLAERWFQDYTLACEQFAEAGVHLHTLEVS